MTGAPQPSPVPIRDVGERGLLAQLASFVPAGDPRLAVGFGDDGAVWDPDPAEKRAPLLVATTDTMVEGTHFRVEWAKWDEIGRKLVASNVSDLAAMAARPLFALVSLACRPTALVRDVRALYTGIGRECDRWGVRLIGGDTVRAAEMVLTLALVGEKDRATAAARRDTLQVGQRLYVTGNPGESGAGLALLAKQGRRARQGAPWRRRLVDRHLLPTPRLTAGIALGRAFSDLAAIDVSDGLDNELRLLAEASGAEVEIWTDSLPVSRDLMEYAKSVKGVDVQSLVLCGGEDYELLFATTAGPKEVQAALARESPRLAVHPLGVVSGRRPGGRVVYRDAAGRSVALPRAAAFEHFPRKPDAT